MANTKEQRPIMVKRVAARKEAPHGGAWKLAYADFMTALMAFFLLLWLLSSATPQQLSGIAEYFQMPLRDALNGGPKSSEGASIINGGGTDLSRKDGAVRKSSNETVHDISRREEGQIVQAASEIMERRDQRQLQELQVKLQAAVEANPLLRQFRQQIRIDSTMTGLRIEIVDSKKRPMFATASADVQPYMRDILREIGHALNDVPNRIVVQGHTDAVQYSGGQKGYSNWELSADRANASRRELIAGGMDEGKVLRVLGLASTQNLNKTDPLAAENRRISVIVLNRRSEQAMLREDGTSVPISNQPGSAEQLLQPKASVAPAKLSAGDSHSGAVTAAPAPAYKER